jgi:SNF family Na+-dependent transporter
MGVILAVAGSAIGLGNFLRFPAKAALYGGGAFMVPYFAALLLLGMPLMWIEWTIGRFGGGFGHSTAPGMFHSIWEKNRFIKYFGVIGIFGPIVIFTYYTYVESWLLGYTWFALTGRYAGCADRDSMAGFLNGYRGIVANEHFGGLGTAYLFFVLTFAANLAVLLGGVRRGIQRLCEWAMPLLFAFAIVLAIRVFTLGTPDPAQPDRSVAHGLGFLWNPNWSRLAEARVWLEAAGQIFFTLSVGIGVILTYASYLQREDDVALSGLTAAAANEVAEVVLGGSIVVPAAFAFFGATATAAFVKGGTFDLGFVTMPLVLQRLPASGLFGVLWFALLFLAGLTSSISLAQPAVAFLEDEFNFSRRKAVLVFGAVTFALCHLAIFGLARGAVDELDFWGGTFCLVVFGLVETVLFGWVFAMDRAWTELHAGSDLAIPRVYRFVIRYVTPLFLLAILVFWFAQDGLPLLLLKGVPRANVPWMLGVRAVLVLLFALLAYLVWHAWRNRAAREVPR